MATPEKEAIKNIAVTLKTKGNDKIRFSYANIYFPKEMENGGWGYSVNVLVPKTHPQAEEAKAAISKIAMSNWDKATRPSGEYRPWRDGDEMVKDEDTDEMVYKLKGEENRGCWVIPAYAYVTNEDDTRPFKIVGRYKTAKKKDGTPTFPNLGPNDSPRIYSGDYGCIKLEFYASKKKKPNRVGCSIKNIQYWEEGVRLAGASESNADEDFDEAEDADDTIGSQTSGGTSSDDDEDDF